MKNRLICMLMIFTLALTLLPATVLAAELGTPPEQAAPEHPADPSMEDESAAVLLDTETYRVTFSANGGSGEKFPETVTAGVTYVVPSCPFTAPEGQRFQMWSIDGGTYAAGERYVFTKDTTMTAIWTSAAQDSGCITTEKLSPAEIQLLLAANPTTMPSKIFDVEPQCTAPYAIGKVNEALLQQVTDRLNALRRIAGLPAVTLDAELCEIAQYGAVLLAAPGTEFSHYPSQPDDMDDSFYNTAISATSTSNIFAGEVLTCTVDGFMDDSDGSNVSRLGHRRWQLNPALGKIGFGYALSTKYYSRYTTEKVFDRSGVYGSYDFIGWPASGAFPADLFTSYVAWSVTLNPSKYASPVQSEITVTLTQESDGTVWTFSGAETYTASSYGEYFGVDTGGYGVSNCIIFRPAAKTTYQGLYTVTIDGLKDRSGNPVEFSYQVDFFSLSSAQTGSYPVTFDPNGGGGNAVEKAQTNGTHYVLPPSPVREGYAFTGWYTAPSGGAKVTDASIVNLSAAQTLYAHWTPQSIYLAQGSFEELTWTLCRRGGNNQITVTGELASGETVIAAAYQEDGKLRAATAITVSGGAAVLPSGSDYVKLFRTGAGYAPVCEAIQIPAD